MKAEQLIQEIIDLYGEHIEMSSQPQNMLIDILAKKLIDERSETQYLKDRLKKYEIANYSTVPRMARLTTN